MVNDWMRGELAAEDIVKYISDSLQLKYKDVWNSLEASAGNLKLIDNLELFLDSLKAKYTLILFTDNFDTFTRFTVPNNFLYKKFDVIVNSADVGLLKCDNDGASFLSIAQDDIKNSILIDDSESSKDTFMALGGRVIQGYPGWYG